MRIFIFIIVYGCLQSCLSAQPAVSIWEEMENGEFTLWVKSNLPCPSQVFAQPEAMDTTFLQFLPRFAERMLISFPTDSIDNIERFKETMKYDIILGHPNAIPDPEYLYLLPFPPGKSYELAQGNNGQFTHNEPNTKHAFDFAMPEGSTVTAARGGIVGYVDDTNNEGGPDESFLSKSNQTLICHDDGTVAIYGHLKYNGALVGVGDRVFPGQAIGLSGNTGYSTTPHLHFAVMITEQSTKIRFRNLPKNLIEGRFYKQEGY